ncbi:hypothetical protein AWM75_07735 [Aerococcus urinaehominis]|uniref:Prephenate dehydratase n=1 Tax=Aerococcus urinaehominis TaxID=128944 RepID=A0A0X8FNE9_9LACT|nr:prephenate dehydratase domain-containing protein [Aerococcus urinaehominis]AMB99862.1 hypothetical protein AWM75_07735 [Aerococcus urinaehominis]SDM54112.1 prephenate dehydratase [Aerococcus urinaehominis]
MKIAYQGIPGSYSHASLIDYLKINQIPQKQVDMVTYTDFAVMVADLVQGHVDRAVMPVENSTTGLITRTLDHFRYQPVCAIQELYQPVQHTLWGLPGAQIADLEVVYSHPEALSQCQSFFAAYPHIKAEEYHDTAGAARFVSQSGNPKYGALSSATAGALYGLTSLQDKIQSETTNMTRFFVMERLAVPKAGLGAVLNRWRRERVQASRLMLYVETRHEPGALAKLLDVFQLFDCNLNGLDARPIKDKPFNYGFFIEVDTAGLALDRQVFWQTLEYAAAYVQLIGCYQAQEVLVDYL